MRSSKGLGNKSRKTRKTRSTRKGGAFSRIFRKTKVHPNITSHANPLHKSLSPKSSKSKSPSISKSKSKSNSLTSPKSPNKMYYTFDSYVFDVVYKPHPQNFLTFRCKNIPSEIRKNFIDEMNSFKHIRGHNQKQKYDQDIVVSISNYKENILVILGQIPSFKIEDGKLIFDEKYKEIGNNFSGTFSYKKIQRL